MFETKKRRGVDAREVQFCRLCGAEIVQLRYANGQTYWTNVINEMGRGRHIITGEGNNYNFKPHHDCVGAAVTALSWFEPTYREFMEKHAAAVAALTALDTNDQALKKYEMDEQTCAIFKRLRESAEAALKSLNDQKPSIDAQINRLRENLKLLQQGRTIIPADQPAIGRTLRVIKGRSAPKGAEGKIFWMGIDQFREGTRVAFETADGQKHYTGSTNIEITKS